MIRINLLGRQRPKAQRATVPIEATLEEVYFASIGGRLGAQSLQAVAA